MANTLETLSWVASIAAVFVAIGGWFFTAKRKTNKAVAKGGTASSGDVRGGSASIVTGHNSPVSLNTTQPASHLQPDWPIRDLFFHIRPDIREEPKEHRWVSVGRDVRDKFSTSQLKVWGRRIENSRRLSLAEIPAEEWQRAEFTYWFLSDQYDDQSLDVDCYPSSRGSAPRHYAGLRVNRAQALTIWPKHG